MKLPIKEKQSFNGCHIFRDSNGELMKLYYSSEEVPSIFKGTRKIGEDLIKFCEIDFDEWKIFLQNMSSHKLFDGDTIDISEDDYDDFMMKFDEKILTFGEINFEIAFYMTIIFNEIMTAQDDGSASFLLTNADSLIVRIAHIINIQRFFINALHTCFHENNNTYSNKVLTFFSHNQDLIDYQFTAAFGFFPTTKGALDTDKLMEIFEETGSVFNDYFTETHKDLDRINIADCAIAGNIFDLYFFELLELFKQGIHLQKCWLCEQFFIPKTKKTTLFCDRIVRNNRTCKQVGAKIKFNAEKEKDKYLKEYDRIYNRYYTRAERYDYADLTNGRDKIQLSFDDFFHWSKMAKSQRKLYLMNAVSGDELIGLIDVF
ncbi:MAG: DUF6076 domain-containing protein [Firmicutes bacterium]|nr:DUF6076 domain-containing protein [Bacillota bacterium]